MAELMYEIEGYRLPSQPRGTSYRVVWRDVLATDENGNEYTGDLTVLLDRRETDIVSAELQANTLGQVEVRFGPSSLSGYASARSSKVRVDGEAEAFLYEVGTGREVNVSGYPPSVPVKGVFHIGRKVRGTMNDSRVALDLPSEMEGGKPSHDDDFEAGFVAGQAAFSADPNISAQDAERAYRRVSRKHGTWWVDGFTAAIDLGRGAYATMPAQIAREMRLASDQRTAYGPRFFMGPRGLTMTNLVEAVEDTVQKIEDHRTVADMRSTVYKALSSEQNGNLQGALKHVKALGGVLRRIERWEWDDSNLQQLSDFIALMERRLTKQVAALRGASTKLAKGVDIHKLFKDQTPNIDPDHPGDPIDWEKGLYHLRREDGYLALRDSAGLVALARWDGTSFFVYKAPGVGRRWPYQSGFIKYRQPKRLADELEEYLHPVSARFYPFSYEVSQKRQQRREHAVEPWQATPEQKAKAKRLNDLLLKKRDRIALAMVGRVRAHFRGPNPDPWEEFNTQLQSLLDADDYHGMTRALGLDAWAVSPSGVLRVLSGLEKIGWGHQADRDRDYITTDEVIHQAPSAIGDFIQLLEDTLDKKYDELVQETKPSPRPLVASFDRALDATFGRTAKNPPNWDEMSEEEKKKWKKWEGKMDSPEDRETGGKSPGKKSSFDRALDATFGRVAGDPTIDKALKGLSKSERQRILQKTFNQLNKEEEAEEKKFHKQMWERARSESESKKVIDEALKGLGKSQRNRILQRAIEMGKNARFNRTAKNPPNWDQMSEEEKKKWKKWEGKMDSPEDRETGGKSPGKKSSFDRALDATFGGGDRPFDDRTAFQMSDPSEFVDAISREALEYHRNPAELRNAVGEVVDEYSADEIRKYLFDMRDPKTSLDKWGNMKVTWDFGRGKKIKGIVRWDQGRTWFEDEHGRIQEPMPHNVVRMLMRTLLKPKGGGVVRRRRRAAMSREAQTPGDVLRSGFFPEDVRGGTKLFLTYDESVDKYHIASRFEHYFTTANLNKATKVFEDLLMGIFPRSRRGAGPKHVKYKVYNAVVERLAGGATARQLMQEFALTRQEAEALQHIGSMAFGVGDRGARWALTEVEKILGTTIASTTRTAGHFHDGKYWYADTAFINAVQHVYPGSTLNHLGFGEFMLKTPDGDLEFDRMRGKDFPGQSGRSHRLYDNAGGKVVNKAVKLMERSGKSVAASTTTLFGFSLIDSL